MEPHTLDALAFRARALAQIRRFFSARRYLEVDTPLLAPALIPEGNLEVFATTLLPPPGQSEAPAQARFLIPSPELWMKRLLAAGSGSIFQICHCFRNGEPPSPLHSPEFTMLEWYTRGADYRDSMDTAEELCASLLTVEGASGPDLKPPFRRLSMNEAFETHLGRPLEALLGEREMQQELRRQDLAPAPTPMLSGPPTPMLSGWCDGFHTLFLACVEPALAEGPPVILYDYPAAIPTLARRKGDSPWAERWELYARGVELANCYSEETDPVRLREFFDSQGRFKRAARVPHAPDSALVGALAQGLPPCSGTALGVDRLLMLLLGARDITSTGLFVSPGSRSERSECSELREPRTP